MDFSPLTPAQVDELWLEAAQPRNAAQRTLNDTLATIRRYEKHRTPTPDYLVERVAKLRTTIAQENARLEPFEAEWDRRGGWSRAYIVPDGHIHRSTACSSLHPTTLVAWLPEQSGWDEDRIVEAAGIVACTICYPSAPVDALRAALAAKKAEGECPGSRSYDHDSSGLRYMSPRARCNHCRQTISATSTGKLRAHKAPAPDPSASAPAGAETDRPNGQVGTTPVTVTDRKEGTMPPKNTTTAAATKTRSRSARKTVDAARQATKAPAAPVVEDAPAPVEDVTGQKPEDALAKMQALEASFLAEAKTLGASDQERKAAYTRLRAVNADGKLKTVLYVNFATAKTVRLEFPTGSGYDVVKIATDAEAASALARLGKAVEAFKA